MFDDDRYFDIFIEYAKVSVEDLLIKITVHNRGPEPAVIHVLPTFWFRNTWSWSGDIPKPGLTTVPNSRHSRDCRVTLESGRLLSLLRERAGSSVH